jgi:rhodanese-related sulfurtransferase
MAEIETIDAVTAVALHGQEGVVFVDIRDVRELERKGLIPEAFHAPRGMLEYWVDPDSKYHRKVFSAGKRLVLY